MRSKNRYYVYRDEGKITRLARLGGDGAYGWESGKWVYMPSLWKIENDITDFEEISEKEAQDIMKGAAE